MRTCMFCSNKASTKEDAWPKWLVERFPTSNTSYMEAERAGKTLGSWRTGKRPLLLKWLCKSCNNGWMSKLESKAKPVLESIFCNTLNELTSLTQLTLASWSVKTAMVLEALDPRRSWFYSDDERHSMRNLQALPPRTSVWIATCVSQPNLYSSAKDHWSTPAKDGCHAYVTTMAFGSIAFQVVSIKTSAVIPANVQVTYDVAEGPWDETLVQVWPIAQESIAWPPKYGLNSEIGLEALTERLSVGA
ncbi:MAG: hypothetical protein JW818_12925 [Pirellulales bacterium]|nr:hypothetical protein [Pirellulales bacterium]